MEMAEDAFRSMFPTKHADYDFCIKYSGRFKGYNANVQMRLNRITFNLSKDWRAVSRDIKIGLLQELLGKLFKNKQNTGNIELYHIFMKKVHIAIPKTRTVPQLEESFNRVNEIFFAGMLEQPNLKWNNSSRKLGTYDYGSDTITITTMLENSDIDMMDYVMYHEMLHKKHKFNSSKGRLHYHTKEFRQNEMAFPNQELIERKLRTLRPKRKNVRAKSPLSRLFSPFFD